MWAARKSGGGRVIIFGGADEEGDPQGAEFLSVSQLKLTAWSQTHHERPTQETAATHVRAYMHACVCVCVAVCMKTPRVQAFHWRGRLAGQISRGSLAEARALSKLK